jgi:hypothetical protein
MGATTPLKVPTCVTHPSDYCHTPCMAVVNLAAVDVEAAAQATLL